MIYMDNFYFSYRRKKSLFKSTCAITIILLIYSISTGVGLDSDGKLSYCNNFLT